MLLLCLPLSFPSRRGQRRIFAWKAAEEVEMESTGMTRRGALETDHAGRTQASADQNQMDVVSIDYY